MADPMWGGVETNGDKELPFSKTFIEFLLNLLKVMISILVFKEFKCALPQIDV